MQTDNVWLIHRPALDALISALPASPEAVLARDGRRIDGARKMTARGSVAIIPIRGIIFPRATGLTDFLGEIINVTTLDTLAVDLQMAREKMMPVIFPVDSPGGLVTGTNEFADMVYEASFDVPVAVHSHGLMASAAYWAGSAAAHIRIDPTAMLGSIGTVFMFALPGESASKYSRIVEIVSEQSPMKRADPTTEAGAAEWQRMANQITDVFGAKVARNRDVNVATVFSDFGRGSMRVGDDAVKMNMADQIGSLESLITDMQAGRIPLRQHPRTFTGLGRPRVAAAINHNSRGANMNTIETPAAEQLETPAPAISPEVVALQAQVAELTEIAKASALKAQAAETDKLTTQARAKVEAWKHEGALTGDSVAAVEAVYIAAMTGQPVSGAQIEAMVAKLPRFDTSRLSAGAVKHEPHSDPVTDEDRRRAAIDPAAARRVAAANASAKK